MTHTNLPNSVTICNHPLLQQNLSILRDACSHHEVFRLAMSRVSQIILLEATTTLPLSKTIVETPIAKTETQILSPEVPILIIPILRAGLMMSDAMMNLIPSASIYHIGLYRDKKTLQPITYYNMLPAMINYDQARVFILDPMLATGGSILSAVEIIRKLDVKESNITIVSIIAAPEGIKAVSHAYPNIKIFAGALDERLDDHAHIVPGLGDAGDRAFGTM